MTRVPKVEISNQPAGISETEIQAEVNNFCQKLDQNLHLRTLEIIFVTKEEIRIYNRRHRGIDTSTDVLSFPQANQHHPNSVFGTILISPEDAAERSEPLIDLIKHGLLHLAGFDHDQDNAAWAEAAEKINHRMGI